MAMKFVKVYYDWLDVMEPLSDSERGRLVTAVLKYARGEHTQELTGGERYAFSSFKAQIDKDNGIRSKACERKRRQRAGHAVTSCDIEGHAVTSCDPPSSLPSPPTPPVSISSSPKEKPPKGGKKKAPFVPPTLAQVEEYCRSRGNSVDPKRFYDYFDAGDWKDSRGEPVRSWKQKLITWEGNTDAKPKKEIDPYANII